MVDADSFLVPGIHRKSTASHAVDAWIQGSVQEVKTPQNVQIEMRCVDRAVAHSRFHI